MYTKECCVHTYHFRKNGKESITAWQWRAFLAVSNDKVVVYDKNKLKQNAAYKKIWRVDIITALVGTQQMDPFFATLKFLPQTFRPVITTGAKLLIPFQQTELPREETRLHVCIVCVPKEFQTEVQVELKGTTNLTVRALLHNSASNFPVVMLLLLDIYHWMRVWNKSECWTALDTSHLFDTLIHINQEIAALLWTLDESSVFKNFHIQKLNLFLSSGITGGFPIKVTQWTHHKSWVL